MDPVTTTVVANTTKTVIDPIATRLVNAIERTVKYPFKVGANVRALQPAIDALTRRRNDVNTRVQTGTHQPGQQVREEVAGWMTRARTIEDNVRVIEKEYESRCLSFNCWSNYKISKNAAKLLLKVQEMHIEGASYQEAVMQAPPRLVQEVATGLTTTASVISNLELARQYINDDPVGIIGIRGMGGVGKTHLLENINNSYLKNSPFNVVVLVPVSKSCSIATIQTNIVDKLGLDKNTNEERQADIIRNFLTEKKFLLLLDDLWEELNLKAVGIPLPLGLVKQYKRKVVLTTRLEGVCGQMEVGREIHVACLNEDESLSLFKEKVGNETINANLSIPELARNVVKELGGLPLALITTGRAMYGKRQPGDWYRAIDQLQAPSSSQINVIGREERERVYQRLILSYEYLPSEALKNCLLACSLWPAVSVKNDMIQRWVGLGYIEESDIQKTYDTGHAIIRELVQRYLLEEYDDSTGLELDMVKMHDVIRDMLHWIASDFGENENKWVIKIGGLTGMPNDKIVWRDAEYISFMHNNFSIPSKFTLSSPSNLTTLCLPENRIKNESLSIKENVWYLPNLQYLNLASNDLSGFPLEICKLINLRYLNLSHNLINSIPSELNSLINLKFLHLKDCHIRSIPQGVIPALVSLEILDLSNYNVIWINYNPSFIEELKCVKNLKALGISVCTLEKLDIFNVLPLQTLIVSSFNVSQSTFLLSSSICSKETQRYLVDLSLCFQIELSFKIMGDRFPNLEKLNLEGLRKIVWMDVLPIDAFRRLRELHITDWGSEDITWIAHLQCLQKVNLTTCKKMKNLVRSNEESSSGQQLLPAFPSLKCLNLVSLPLFESICEPNYSTFPSLTYLMIKGCPSLKKLPFPRNSSRPTLKINSIQEFE